MPCQELFNKQNSHYRNQIINSNVPTITIEAGSAMSWKQYSNNNMGINSFGESAPYKEIYKHFDLTSDKIAEFAKKLVK